MHQRKEPRVGLVVLVLLVAAIVAAYLWFRPGRGGRAESIPVTFVFETAEGLTVGDPVSIAGVRVGRVTQVTLEGVGRVRVRIDVAESVRPRQDAWAQIRPLNLMGDVFVSYRPGEDATLVDPGSVFAGAPPAEGAFDGRALMEGLRGAITGGGVLTRDDIRTQLGETLDAVDRALAAVRGLEAEPLVDAAAAGLAAARGAAERLDSTLSHPALSSLQGNVDEIGRNVGELRNGLAQSQDALGRILERIDEGHGNLGRLKSDSTLRRELGALRSLLRRPS